MTRLWTVLPHAPIERLEENLWAIEGELPGDMPLRRRMTIARLSDGRLVFTNGVPLDDESMRAVEAWGEPAFLLVPNGYHRLDLAAFRARYPSLRLLAGEASRARIAKVAAVDGGFELLPRDASVEHVPLATKTGEGVLRVLSGERTSLSFYGDVVMNNPDVPGGRGWVYGRLLDSTGGPRITRIARWFIVADRARLADELRGLAADPSLARLVPCHGHVITDGAAATLRALADRL